MSRIEWAVAAFAGGMALCLAGGIVLAEATVHVARIVPKAPEDHLPQTIEVHATDGALLRGWMFTPPAPSGSCVMVLHGIGGSREHELGFARLFLKENYSVLLPDLRAHGESGGDLITYGVLEAGDVKHWVDWLSGSQKCSGVYGLGESLGAGILLQSLAVESRFRAVVAECPYASLVEVGRDRVAALLPIPKPIGRVVDVPLIEAALLYVRIRYGVDARQASPETAVRMTLTPILLIHGTDDAKTPVRHSREIAAQNPRIVLWEVPGAGHTEAWSTEPVEFPRRVLAWFRAQP
jgi:pimeloyl-ACP methyl ester carboxylesterase